jgi:hypothetical protein
VNRGAAVPAVAGLHLQRDPVGELRHNAISLFACNVCT